MTPVARAPVLRVQGLHCHFPIRHGLLQRVVGFIRAVDGVDLEVPAGGTLALVGESGCGKTTLGRAVLRIVEPGAGQIWFEGKDLMKLSQRELRPLRRSIQMVFQDPMTSLNPRMRVRDIVAEGLASFGLAHTRAEIEARVASLMQRVKLDSRQMMRYPHEFSGGQRQRIGIARALAVEPKLIVCDEAVSALDVSIQAQILNLLRELQQQDGLSYLFIAHDLSVVRYLADFVSVMYLGQIVEAGENERIFSDPRHPYTRGLLRAAPSIDPLHPTVTAQVLGDVPSAAHPPPGCRFNTRCTEAFDRCYTAAPDLYPVSSGGFSRCFLTQENRDT